MNYKLRIKHPSGAEFEAEGPAEFILSEKDGFLNRLQSPEAGARTAEKEAKSTAQDPDWNAMTETKNGLTALKDKHPGIAAGDAALLLLAAENQLRSSREISAITLSKAVKTSGYAPERLDRALSKGLKEGLIKASGTKRNRIYRITDKGLESAWLIARKLDTK